MIQSFFMTTVRKPNPFAGVGGACSCQAKIKLEVRGEGLEFLAGAGFKATDDLAGSCPTCGRNYRFFRLSVDAVEDVTSNEGRGPDWREDHELPKKIVHDSSHEATVRADRKVRG